MRNKIIFLSMLVLAGLETIAQQQINVTFQHTDKTLYGTLQIPQGTGKFPVIIIGPGSGPNDRDGTVIMTGANAECLYPGLTGQVLKPYKDLSQALADSGYAVLRYDKLEYTYSNPGTITFEKLWLPVESAISFVKTRSEIDSNRIILLGHSESSALFPFIARNRTDIKALISVAGARTPFDSILARQIVEIAQFCNGDVPQAQSQASQILAYFDQIRNSTWNSSTPALFGVPPAVWEDYLHATDSLAFHYNSTTIPRLFLGLGDDFNVPPSELTRLQNDITTAQDFWLIPGLNHLMTDSVNPEVSSLVPDTIVYWLRMNNLASGTSIHEIPDEVQLTPNPAGNYLRITAGKPISEDVTMHIFDISGKLVYHQQLPGMLSHTVDVSMLTPGYYSVTISGGKSVFRGKFIKQ